MGGYVPATLDEGLRALLAGAPGALADPHRYYRQIREHGRAYAHDEVVFLSTYPDVKWALEESALLSSRGLVEGSRIAAARARMAGDARAAFDEVVGFQANFASRNDGADHARLRRIAHRAFTPRRIAALKASAERYVAALLDELAGREVADLMAVAGELPLMMVAELLDVPQADRALIHRWSIALSASNGSTEPGVFLAARDATRAFRAYVAQLRDTHRRAAERSQLVNLLMDAEEGAQLSDEELAAMFVQLLFAGHETTAGLIGIGLLELLKAPDQWRTLVDTPALIPDAVEELLRLVSPSQFASRLARTAFELDGTHIDAGRTVIVVIAAANRDPAVFADPDRVDVRRPNARRHLAFGFGPHFCLGAALARLEAQAVLEALTRRFPATELADTTFEWSGGAMLRHLSALPVRLGPDSGGRPGA